MIDHFLQKLADAVEAAFYTGKNWSVLMSQVFRGLGDSVI
jgi:hypothetical protein